jgi:hypothetical protein
MISLTDLQQSYLALYGLTKAEAKEKVFYKTNIIPDVDSYRVSVTKFQDGNSHAVVVLKDTLEEAQEFVKNATTV